MSEVDRLSSAGPAPALPINEKRQSRQGGSSNDAQPHDPPERPPEAKADGSDPAATGTHRIPKSILDEYA